MNTNSTYTRFNFSQGLTLLCIRTLVFSKEECKNSLAIFYIIYLCSPTDIHQRYQTLYTGPCNGVDSHINLGVFWFLLTTHTKANVKQMHSRSSRAARLSTRDCLHLHAQTAVHARNLCTWQTMIILITGKPKDPQIEPYAGIKMVQGLVSLVYICGPPINIQIFPSL